LQAALFIFYLLFFSSIIPIIPFFKNAGLGRSALIALFFLKIAAGIAYAKFYTLPRYYSQSDTWRFYRLSLQETKWLKRDPISFVTDLFHSGYQSSGNIFSGQGNYWNDLKSNVIIKLTAIFNVPSLSNYYVDIIFFNFLFLFGLIGIFRVFYSLFPGKKGIILTGVFLIPSSLFWCSGIHKDGLLLSALGVIIYCLNQCFKFKLLPKHLIFILLAALLIFSLRNYILFALLPAILAWWLAEGGTVGKYTAYIGIYAVLAFTCLAMTCVFPSFNVLKFIVDKQAEFLKLSAGSAVHSGTLEPTLISFIHLLPDAVDMALFRPHPGEIKNLSYIPAAGENILLAVLFVVAIFRINKKLVFPVVLCCVAFSISILMICGYTIPISGAITRYKSLVLPLLVTPLLCVCNFSFPTRGQRQ
jgi:hypothetical protein